jgi:hypothetical protein
MTRKCRCMTAFAIVAWLSSAPVAMAQSFDGTWKGQITCAKLSFTKGTQKVPMTLTISGAQATYSRDVYNRDNTAVVGKEEGTGMIASNGIFTLISTWKSAGANPKYSYVASYSGTINRNVANLRGTQVWKYDRKAENRDCTIALKR